MSIDEKNVSVVVVITNLITSSDLALSYSSSGIFAVRTKGR